MVSHEIVGALTTFDDDFLKIHGVSFHEGAFWIDDDIDDAFIVPIVSKSILIGTVNGSQKKTPNVM